jgi:hypothetical protein
VGIDEPIRLKQYRGLTIRQIYQGSNCISLDIFKDYFSDLISSQTFLSNLDDSERELLRSLNLKVTSNFFVVNGSADFTVYDHSRNLARLFRLRPIYRKKSKVFYSINEFIRISNLYRDEPIVTINGDPGYVHWCLNNENLTNFCVKPDDVEVLEGLDVHQYLGIQVRHTGDSFYEFNPYYSVHRMPFEQKTIKINNRKFDKLSNGNNTQFNDRNMSMNESYSQFNGSYAQDVEGWSDQDINDALGGNPDAYWNLD